MMRRVVHWARPAASVAAWVFGIACFGVLLAIGIGPRTGRYSTLTVLSGSMRPGIPVGAVVVVTPERPSDLRVGQIVTYGVPVGDHHVISHRVVKVVQGGDHPTFQTKGDANNGIDPWLVKVAGSRVWRVRATVPGLGWMIRWLRRPVVHTVGVLVFPAVLAVFWLVDIWRGDRTTTASGQPEAPDGQSQQDECRSTPTVAAAAGGASTLAVMAEAARPA